MSADKRQFNSSLLDSSGFAESMKEIVGDDFKPFIDAAKKTLIENPVLNCECSSKSVLDGVLKLAVMGLKLDHKSGEAWLTPKNMRARDGSFYKVAVAMPGIRAFERKLMETGGVATVESDYVLAQDYFKFSQGLNKTLEHTRNLNPDEGKPNHVIAAWGVLQTKDERRLMRVLTQDELPDPKEKSFMTHEQRSNYAGRRAVMRDAINTLLHDPELVKNQKALEQFSQLYVMEKEGYEQGEPIIQSDPIKQVQPNIDSEEEVTTKSETIAPEQEPSEQKESESKRVTMQVGDVTRIFSTQEELDYAKKVFAVLDEQFVLLNNNGEDVTSSVSARIGEGAILKGFERNMNPEQFLDRFLASIAKAENLTIQKSEPEAVGSKILEEARREGLKSIGHSEETVAGPRKGGVR